MRCAPCPREGAPDDGKAGGKSRRSSRRVPLGPAAGWSRPLRGRGFGFRSSMVCLLLDFRCLPPLYCCAAAICQSWPVCTSRGTDRMPRLSPDRSKPLMAARPRGREGAGTRIPRQRLCYPEARARLRRAASRAFKAPMRAVRCSMSVRRIRTWTSRKEYLEHTPRSANTIEPVCDQ